MRSNRFGKKFIFSPDHGFVSASNGESRIFSDGGGSYHGNDGSEGYIYSDGSGYYHGADGSEGTIYSDGSASYRGSDGSDGYIYPDGSGYYHGADGSDGQIFSDGSGYFNDAPINCDGTPCEKNNILTTTPSESFDSTSAILVGGAFLGALLGNSIAEGTKALASAALQYEREKEHQRQERRRKFWSFCGHNWKTILGTLLAILLPISVFLLVVQLGKLTPIGYDYSEFHGQNFETVVTELTEAGFTNIHAKPSANLTYDQLAAENSVYQVDVAGMVNFTAETKKAYDVKITIYYYTLKELAVPISSKTAKGSNYLNIMNLLISAGFVDVRTEPKNSMLAELFTENGELESITINGDKNFNEGDKYRPDAVIILTYYSHE